VTSDKCYLNDGTSRSFHESDPLGGHDPYSSSKACVEVVTESYRQSFFSGKKSTVHLATARAGNVIGGGDWAKDRLIPDAIRALYQKKAIPVRNSSYVRPWQHVLEPLSGYLLLGLFLSSGNRRFQTSWNFGPSRKDIRRVSEVVSLAIKFWGKGSAKYQARKDSRAEALTLFLNCEKAKKELNWKPRWRLNKAIEETILWYRHYLEMNVSPFRLCQEQINNFTE